MNARNGMWRIVLMVLLVAAAFATHAQEGVALSINGRPAATLDAGTLATLPSATATLSAHGERATWSGVRLDKVLQHYGVPHGKALRGSALTGTMRVSAKDGYVVVFSLGELDPDLGATQVLLVNRRDGQPLDGKLGPWRLVIPGDTRPARWVRNVTAIDVQLPAPAHPTP